jgi:hypothetical protein
MKSAIFVLQNLTKREEADALEEKTRLLSVFKVNAPCTYRLDTVLFIYLLCETH